MRGSPRRNQTCSPPQWEGGSQPLHQQGSPNTVYTNSFNIDKNWMQCTLLLILGGLGLQLLEAGFGSRPEIEVRLWQKELWIQAARPPEAVASGKALACQLCSDEVPGKDGKEWNRQSTHYQEKGHMWVDTRADSEICAFVVVWITFMGHFFLFSFGQSSCLAWVRSSIWFTSGPSHACLNQDGF